MHDGKGRGDGSALRRAAVTFRAASEDARFIRAPPYRALWSLARLSDGVD